MNLDVHTIADIIGIVVVLVGVGRFVGSLKAAQDAKFTALEKDLEGFKESVRAEIGELRRLFEKYADGLRTLDKEHAVAAGVFESRLGRLEDSWEGFKRDLPRERRSTLVGHDGG